MTPRDALAMVLSTLEAERREADACYTREAADTDAALAALEAAISASETRSADIRDALERGLPDDAERALMKFGAMVVRRGELWAADYEASGVGLLHAPRLLQASPGVRAAVDRLLAPEAVPS